MTSKPVRLAWFILSQVLIIVILLEVGSRVFWRVKFGIPFWATDEIIYAFYPQLKDIKQGPGPKNPDSINILFLGGSVLNNRWSGVEAILREKLSGKLPKTINIYNLAEVAHTTLDSYYKYKYLDNIPFDLVVVYHGINDTRTNNAPPTVFRDDYWHYSWYRFIKLYDKYRLEIKYISFPYTAYYGLIKFCERLRIIPLIKAQGYKDDWLQYGATIKTATPFKANVTKIIDLAASRGQPVLLMTFAYYLPPNYTRENFRQKLLDYGSHRSPLEIWGKPEHVVAGLAAHNLVIRQLADSHQGLYFVDQEKLMPKNGKIFNDICHFTQKGSEAFVSNMGNLIVEILASRRKPAGEKG